MKNKTYKRFCKSTDPRKKNKLHIKFKTYRNSIVKLTRQFKEYYFKSYFENNKKSSKEIWKGIRNLINIKNSKKTQQIALSIKNQTITDDFLIVSQFNNLFTSIASKLVEKIPTFQKTLNILLGRNNENTFFLIPTSTAEVEDTLSSFYLNKALGPNSVPMKKISKNNFQNHKLFWST